MTLEKERDFILSDYSDFSKIWKIYPIADKNVVVIVNCYNVSENQTHCSFELISFESCATHCTLSPQSFVFCVKAC